MATSFKNKPELSYIINDKIRGTEVRIIGDDIESEVLPLKKALELAESKDMDLILINFKVTPPICRVADYGKFLYEEKKRIKAQTNNSTKVVEKEIRLTPNTDTNDFNFKLKHAHSFLSKGNRLRVSLQFKGREIAHKERGEIMLLNMATELEEVGIVEMMPKLEGKKMFMLLRPKK